MDVLTTYLIDSLKRLLGFTQLELQLELLKGDLESAAAYIEQLEAQVEEQKKLLDKAHFVHLQDEAKIAEVAGDRWKAIAALTGGIEMLQHSWHDRSASLVPQSDKYQLYRRCSNELGGLKNTIQRQFGIHPSQVPKTTDHLLPERIGVALLKD